MGKKAQSQRMNKLCEFEGQAAHGDPLSCGMIRKGYHTVTWSHGDPKIQSDI